MPIFSLKRKIIGITVTIIFVMSATFGFFMKTAVHETLESEIDKRAVAIGKHFVELSADADLSGSTSLLRTHLKDYITTDSYLAYIVIFDTKGEIQAHTFKDGIPTEIIAGIAAMGSNVDNSIHIFRKDDGTELENFFISAGGSLKGGVHIGIYESKIVKSINALMLKLLPLLLIVIGIGLIVAFLMSSALTKPLHILSDGVKRVTCGDLDFHIEIKSTDEIGLLAASFNDMTTRLKESTVSREFMEQLINTMQDILVVISPDGTIINVNTAYTELFGVEPSEIIGRHADIFHEDEAVTHMYQAYLKSLRSGNMLGIECTCSSIEGDSIHLLLSLAVMRNSDGSPQAVICAAQNISDIKAIQHSLQQKQLELETVNHNLEDIVASRTAELAIGNEGLRAEVAERQKKTEELRAAIDLAESANRAKSEFLANMSHEMRTPLNSIIGGAEYFDPAGFNEDQQRCLKMIRHAGDSLLVLINDLIDLSRIEAGQLEISCRPLNPAATLTKTIEMIEQAAQKKNISMTLLIDEKMPLSVEGDPLRLQQVLVNLVANAVKFTGDGGVVSVRATADLSDNNKEAKITFIVEDSGIGIEQNKLDIIFDSFSQADSSITRRFGGSGLGLSISRKLVEAMNGTINVKSTPQAGSTFSFTIPFLISETKSDNVTVEKRTVIPDIIESVIPGNRRVLLVDDSLENRELLRLLLSNIKLELTEAENGEEALKVVMATPFDMVLMDIQMPVMDGYTATERIREYEKSIGRAPCTIIALTAHAYEADIKKCLEAGCDDHIAKPFKKKRLFECLNKYLGRTEQPS